MAVLRLVLKTASMGHVPRRRNSGYGSSFSTSLCSRSCELTVVLAPPIVMLSDAVEIHIKL